MFPTLLQYSDYGLLILRLAVGLVFLPHGWGKLKDPKATAQGLGWSAGKVKLLGLVETVCAVLMILGFRTQYAAIPLGIVMLGAIYYKRVKWHKTFMGVGGWELDFIILAGTILLLLSGAGAFALE